MSDLHPHNDSTTERPAVSWTSSIFELSLIELSKLAATPTAALLLAAVVLLSAFSAVGYTWSSTLTPTLADIIGQGRLGLSVAVFGGVSVMCIDRHNGSEAIWLVARPSRRQAVAAKFAASAALGAALAVAALLASTVVALIAVLVFDRAGSNIGGVGEVLLRHPVGFVGAALFGAGLASLSRSYVWSVVIAVVVVPAVESIAASIVATIGDVGPYSSLSTILDAGDPASSSGRTAFAAFCAVVAVSGALLIAGVSRFERSDVGSSS